MNTLSLYFTVCPIIVMLTIGIYLNVPDTAELERANSSIIQNEQIEIYRLCSLQ